MKNYLTVLAFMFVLIPALDLFSKNCNEALDRIHWLAGCWEQRGTNRLSEEQWMSPRGHMMVGMNRTTAGGRAVAYEFIRIEERDGRLYFIAAPSGQAEATFAQVELTDSSVTFANPEHDFPQRIAYRLLPDGSILGQIEGRSAGEVRVIDFPMRRVSCPPVKD
jgi:hypothetical protein